MSTVTIKDFSGQINTDTRTASAVDFRYSENFDMSARNDALFPMKGTVAMTASSGGNNFYIRDFIYGNFGTGIGENVLGYGVQAGELATGEPELYKISDTLPGTTWATALTTTGTSVDDRDFLGGTTAPFNNLFHLHRGFIYLTTATAYLSKIGNVETSGEGATWTPRWVNFTWYTTTQAITHSKDGIMYFAYTEGWYSSSAGYIFSVTNDSTNNPTAFQLPTGWTPNSLCEYGDYLAVALAKNNGVSTSTNAKQSSKVVLWNRDTSQTTLTETIDWGEGELMVMDNIDGHLIGVSLVYNESFNLTPRIVVKEWSGGTVNIINTIYVSTAFAPVLSRKKWRQNNSLYFALKASINGTRHAIFSVSKNKFGRFVVAGDTTINNNVSVTTIDGFAKVGDVWYLNYDSSGLNRTKTSSGYAASSVWQSLMNPNMPIADRTKWKQLVSVQMTYEAIESGGSVTLSYRVDGGLFTNCVTNSTAGSIKSSSTVDILGNNFTSGIDYEFLVESVGVIVTGITYTYKVLNSTIEAYG